MEVWATGGRIAEGKDREERGRKGASLAWPPPRKILDPLLLATLTWPTFINRHTLKQFPRSLKNVPLRSFIRFERSPLCATTPLVQYDDKTVHCNGLELQNVLLRLFVSDNTK